MSIFQAIGSLLQTAVAYADNTSGGGGGNGSSITFDFQNAFSGSCADIQCVLQSILDKLVQLAIPLVAVMVVYGGLQMIFAGGSPEKFTNGKKIIQYAVIGFVVVLLADSVALLIKSILTK